MKSLIQSVLAHRDKFRNSTEALKHIKKDGFRPIKKVHVTQNYYRFRLVDPKEFDHFRIKRIDNKISVVIGYFTKRKKARRRLY